MKYPKLASVVLFVWIAYMKKNQFIAMRIEAKSIIKKWPPKLKIADRSSLIRPRKTKTTKKKMNDQIVLWESSSNGGTVTNNL